jgi:hypothetical protein
MTYKELTEKYLAVDEDLFETEQLTTEIRDILLRGYVCCNNDEIQNAKIMLTGINPSFPEKAKPCPHKVVDKYELSTAHGRYWTRKKNQFGDFVNSMAYFDLFPIRETHQNNCFEKAFEKANDIRRRFLEHTQMAIEDIKPRLIIHANRDSMYYWGIKKYGRGNDTVHPWMGYSVERITRSNSPELPKCCTEERLIKFPLYRINGFISSKERINNKRLHKTNLSYIMEYVMEYRNAKNNKYLYTPEEWKEIIDFLSKG